MTTSPKENAKPPYTEERPWGKFQCFTHGESSTVKIITILPGQATSLQTHEKRDEYWHIISGEGTIVINGEIISVLPGENYFVPRTTKHRMASQKVPLLVLEISTGDFDENDIIRFEDNYGRVSEKS